MAILCEDEEPWGGRWSCCGRSGNFSARSGYVNAERFVAFTRLVNSGPAKMPFCDDVRLLSSRRPVPAPQPAQRDTYRFPVPVPTALRRARTASLWCCCRPSAWASRNQCSELRWPCVQLSQIFRSTIHAATTKMKFGQDIDGYQTVGGCQIR